MEFTEFSPAILNLAAILPRPLANDPGHEAMTIWNTNLKNLDWIEQLVACDEPILKPIDGHLGKTTRSSVYVSK